jgi:hypothetical protein
VNASPLITLAKVRRLDLLTGPDHRLLVPQAVADEILAGPVEDPARQALAGGFGAPFEVTAADAEILGWSLGAGESAVLALARAKGGLAILDDRSARVAAQTLGIRLTGTLGLVIQGAREGRVDSAAELLRELKAAGLRLDDKAIAVALARSLGERWEP